MIGSVAQPQADGLAASFPTSALFFVEVVEATSPVLVLALVLDRPLAGAGRCLGLLALLPIVHFFQRVIRNSLGDSLASGVKSVHADSARSNPTAQNRP